MTKDSSYMNLNSKIDYKCNFENSVSHCIPNVIRHFLYLLNNGLIASKTIQVHVERVGLTVENISQGTRLHIMDVTDKVFFFVDLCS